MTIPTLHRPTPGWSVPARRPVPGPVRSAALAALAGVLTVAFLLAVSVLMTRIG